MAKKLDLKTLHGCLAMTHIQIPENILKAIVEVMERVNSIGDEYSLKDAAKIIADNNLPDHSIQIYIGNDLSVTVLVSPKLGFTEAFSALKMTDLSVTKAYFESKKESETPEK